MARRISMSPMDAQRCVRALAKMDRRSALWLRAMAESTTPTATATPTRIFEILDTLSLDSTLSSSLSESAECFV
jgi:hypothetical protein